MAGAGQHSHDAVAGPPFRPELGEDSAAIQAFDASPELKFVSILFADLSGSTKLVYGKDPEDAQHICDLAINAMKAAVREYRGTVTRVMGDGIMALFGAPKAQEDHAVRACLAAITARRALFGLRDKMAGVIDSDLNLHAGINSGEVLVGAVMNDLSFEYSASGSAVHLAARMEQLAPAGRILITGQTRRLVENQFQLRSVGPLAVKGLPAPVEAFELLDGVARHSPMQARARRGKTRFVGRRAELKTLRRALMTHEAVGQIWSFPGEPGIGKSRLFDTLRRSAGEDWRVVHARCVLYHSNAPYSTIIVVLRLLLQLAGDHDVRSRIDQLFQALGIDGDRSRNAIYALFDLPVPDERWAGLQPAHKKEIISDAVVRLLVSSTASRPTLLLLEDLQWVDTESLSILDALVRVLPRSGIFLLVNYRPEFRHRWANEAHYAERNLAPLSESDAVALIDALTGDERAPTALKGKLVGLAQGNPLFLEELVLELKGKARLASRSDWSAVEVGDLGMSPTIHSVISARIDHLSAGDKRVLRAAAVIGTQVAVPVAAHVSEIDRATILPMFQRLVDADFMHETEVDGEAVLEFKHALTQEVAYSGVPKRRRATMHARVIEAVEKDYPERISELAEFLAYHAERGNTPAKAIQYLRLAGQKAFSRSANAEASRLFTKALDTLAPLMDTEAQRSLFVDLCFDLRNCLELREPDRLIATLEKGIDVAKQLDDQVRLGMLMSYMTHACWVAGRLHRGVEFGRQAAALGCSIGDVAPRVTGAYHLGLLYISLGRFHDANAMFQQVIDAVQVGLLYERFGLNLPPALLAGSYYARSLAELGDFEQALEKARLSLEIANTLDEPYGKGFARFAVGHALLLERRYGEAVDELQAAHDSFVEGRTEVMPPVVAAYLGYALAAAGSPAEGLSILEQAIATTAAMQIMDQQPLRMVFLGEAYWRAGQDDRALTVVQEALDLAHQQGEEISRAYALLQKGSLLLTRRDGDEDTIAIATALLHEALSIATRLGMKPVASRCLEALESPRQFLQPEPNPVAHPAMARSLEDHI